MNRGMRPLITWVGGKQRLADEICDRMEAAMGCKVPARSSKTVAATIAAIRPLHAATRLVEPFCGPFGFTCRFHERFPNVQIVASDTQRLLISLAMSVRDRPVALANALEELSEQWVAQPDKDSKKAWYYALRDSLNEHLAGRDRVKDFDATFMAIMRTGYTGLLRFNASGLINTPAGHCKDKPIADTERILEFSKFIAGWQIKQRGYQKALADVIPGCVVYLDPPYRGTYNDYTAGGFDEAGLPEFMRACIARGASLVVMSQSWDEAHWREVLPDAELQSIERRQGVNADAGEKGRPLVREALLIMKGKT